MSDISVLQRILDRIGVDYIEKGRRLELCCPLHDDNNPSATVYFEGDAFVCFTCDVYYNPVQFVSHYYGVNERKALSILRDTYGVDGKTYFTNNVKLKYKSKKAFSELKKLVRVIPGQEHYKIYERLVKIVYQHQQGLIDEDAFDHKFLKWEQRLDDHRIKNEAT